MKKWWILIDTTQDLVSTFGEGINPDSASISVLSKFLQDKVEQKQKANGALGQFNAGHTQLWFADPDNSYFPMLWPRYVSPKPRKYPFLYDAD